MWNRVTPIALPTTRTLENYNLKAGNTKKKKKKKTVYNLSQAETHGTFVPSKEPSKEYEHQTSSWIQRWADKIELPALQVTP